MRQGFLKCLIMMKKRIFKTTFMALIALGLLDFAFAEGYSNPIDTKLIKEVDVTGDGEGDQIVVRLKANDILSPFSWELSIKSEGHLLLSHNSDDTWMNSFFGEPGYMDGCSGYIECKEKYYFKELINNIIVPYAMINIDGIMEMQSIGPIATQYLQKNQLTNLQADTIISDLQNRIKAEKAVFITVPISPLMTRGLLVYSPMINHLVLVYED